MMRVVRILPRCALRRALEALLLRYCAHVKRLLACGRRRFAQRFGPCPQRRRHADEIRTAGEKLLSGHATAPLLNANNGSAATYAPRVRDFTGYKGDFASYDIRA